MGNRVRQLVKIGGYWVRSTRTSSLFQQHTLMLLVCQEKNQWLLRNNLFRFVDPLRVQLVYKTPANLYCPYLRFCVRDKSFQQKM
ncbi:hypothetical protein L1987_52870 [Smallanthus sonchifolius]|uniref:Uncharacterized protein n=1 Tax=Smallanthus sonchifolius TaxID=185202 RepID=A0ACB9EUZ4_9ASTR|nr:hypothetical protein L1987_52870 [Smallanthus sonchifolius]